jgi:hypothetical protein
MKTSSIVAVMLASLGLAAAGCEERTTPQTGPGEATAGAAVRQAPDPEAAAPTGPAEAAAPSGPPIADTRTQYDFATALAAIEQLPRDQAALKYPELRRDWVARRYQWKVHVVPALCASVERCNVQPFDTGGADRHIVQGWMPRLEIDEADFASIQRACTGAERCTITFRGTLTRLVLSTEEFTALGFTDVEIL